MEGIAVLDAALDAAQEALAEARGESTVAERDAEPAPASDGGALPAAHRASGRRLARRRAGGRGRPGAPDPRGARRRRRRLHRVATGCGRGAVGGAGPRHTGSGGGRARRAPRADGLAPGRRGSGQRRSAAGRVRVARSPPHGDAARSRGGGHPPERAARLPDRRTRAASRPAALECHRSTSARRAPSDPATQAPPMTVATTDPAPPQTGRRSAPRRRPSRWTSAGTTRSPRPHARPRLRLDQTPWRSWVKRQASPTIVARSVRVGPPAQRCGRRLAGGHQHGGVAAAAGRDHRRDRVPGHRAAGLDHLAHREAGAGAEVVHRVPARLARAASASRWASARSSTWM